MNCGFPQIRPPEVSLLKLCVDTPTAQKTYEILTRSVSFEVALFAVFSYSYSMKWYSYSYSKAGFEYEYEYRLRLSTSTTSHGLQIFFGLKLQIAQPQKA